MCQELPITNQKIEGHKFTVAFAMVEVRILNLPADAYTEGGQNQIRLEARRNGLFVPGGRTEH